MKLNILRSPTETPVDFSSLREYLRDVSQPFGLRPVAERLMAGEPLTPEEALLLPASPLFLLSTFVEIASQVKQNTGGRTTAGSSIGSIKPNHVVVNPVFLIPLAQWLEQGEIGSAIRNAEDVIRTVDGQLQLSAPLSIAIDRWEGEFELSVLLKAASEIANFGKLAHQLQFVGPSTAELRMLEKKPVREQDETISPETPNTQPSSSERLSHLLREFKLHRLDRIDGGTDIDLHTFGAARDIKVSVGHDISSFIEAAVYAPIATNYNEEHFYRVIEERLIHELLDIQARIATTGNLRTWFPWFRSALQKFHRTSDQAFGAPLLRTLAFARLVLPEAEFIRAPASLFGRHFVQCAVLFGANDLGYAAVDTATAESLGVPRLSEVSRLLDTNQIFPDLTT